MEIHFECTGGFTGMPVVANITSEALSEEVARKLRELVDSAGFFQLPARIHCPARGNDRFLYTLTVEMDGRRHTVRTSEGAAPEALRRLIDWLAKEARKDRRHKASR